jgi:hypothetical protein
MTYHDEQYYAFGLSGGQIKASSIGDKDFAKRTAKYYRSIKENGMRRFDSVRVMSYEDGQKLIGECAAERWEQSRRQMDDRNYDQYAQERINSVHHTKREAVACFIMIRMVAT